MKIASGQLQLSSTSRALSRQVNLSGATFATLSCQYKRTSFDDVNDYVAIQVSADGGSTWTELARYKGSGTDSTWQTASFDILSYAATNTQIRFATSSALGTSDILYVDNVKIEYALTPATFVVNHTGDAADANLADGVCQTATAGQCTLRAALQQASASTGKNTINFNISGAGSHTIQPGSALPEITDPVVIDGSSEPDFTGVPVIRLDGASAGSSVDGLKFADGSDGSTMRGLMITKFSRDGIYVASGADGITIVGNWIGTTGTGSTGVGNTNTGIESFAVGTVIGGTGAYDGNVITNSGNDGISLSRSGVTGYVIQGNMIGLDPDGAIGGGNADVGLAILNGTGNTIGGTTAAARNVISKNYEGIEINTADNTIQGNYIGTDASGTLNRGNRIGDGVQIRGTANNTIVGGTAAGAGNLIAYNALSGIAILAGTGHQVLGNAIYSNTQLGIDLDTAGITANNGTKNGALPNNDMDFPIITSASLLNCSLTITGYVGSAANQSTFANARVEFFKSAADSTGYGEGQTYLGTLTTDASGNFSGNVSGIGFNSGDRLTATATDSSNNTSEFGPNFQVTTASGSCMPSPFASVARADQLPRNLNGQGVTVAIVDSGIAAHGALQGRIVANNNQTTAPDANDNYGHGTFVAGIIGGAGKYRPWHCAQREPGQCQGQW